MNIEPFEPDPLTKLTWSHVYSHNARMKTLAAGKFKAVCLQTLDEVAETKRPVVITKRGKPVAKLVPITSAQKTPSLKNSVIHESGDLYSTGVVWDASRS
jgi:prevent-host-death family protein